MEPRSMVPVLGPLRTISAVKRMLPGARTHLASGVSTVLRRSMDTTKVEPIFVYDQLS